MTDTYTIEMLSKMTMVQIMEKMNNQVRIIKMLDDDAVNDKKIINKLTKPKPKRKQIKATKSDLQGWLGEAERQILWMIETNYTYAEPDVINTMFDVCDGRFNNKLRPEFRGFRMTKYQTKLDTEEY